MITLMFISLSILPLGALLSGALFFRVKKETLHVPSFLLFGFLTMYVDLSYFHRAYEVSLANGQYGPMAGTIAMFSVITMLNSFCIGLLGAAIYSLFSKLTKKQDEFSKLSFLNMAAIFVLAMSTATYQIINHHTQSASQKIIAKASGELTPELVNELIQIDQDSKDKTMIQSLLMNPNCPESVLKDFSKKPLVVYRATVLKNPNVSSEIVNQLATDENEVVRYHVAINQKVSTEILEQLTKDSSKDVRNKAQAEFDKRKTTTTN
ncbi:hypothetical protein CIK05_05490 [Bdellovibrio sp. qaytius]|nr:hypothetical protein CIK05_05490 [Bdellovibrio sp. qaytius]